MSKWLIASEVLDSVVDRIGRLAAWLLLALVFVTVFDVVTRRYFQGSSTAVQELEWHLHTGIFALCIGQAYLHNAHVRIEILRERWTSRTRAVVEFLGCLVLLIPYMAVLIYFGLDFVGTSYAMGEVSSSSSGLCCRWIIKAILLSGIFIMLMAGISVTIRQFVILFSRSDGVRKTADQ